MNENHLSKFGQIARVKRTLKRVSLADVAAAAGCSASYLSAVEIGVKAPSTELAMKVAAYFGMNLDDTHQLILAAIQDIAAFNKPSLEERTDRIMSNSEMALSALMPIFMDLATEEQLTETMDFVSTRLKNSKLAA